jgi:plastocyanin
MKKIAILILMLSALMIFGCIGGPPPTNETNETTAPPPVQVVKAPSFSITMPLNEEVLSVSGDVSNVTLTMNTQNLVLKKPSGAAKKGEGYFQITVDGKNPEVVTSKSYALNNLALGSHTVKVELYNNDKTPYSPAISKQVSFTLEKEKPKEYVPQSYAVTIANNAYNPANITVKVKDSITWTNSGSMPATATCTVNGKIMFDTKSITPGKSATVTFTEPLVCEYYSQLFRATKGYIIVEPNGVD